MYKLLSRVYGHKKAKPFNELSEYIILDCEYQTSNHPLNDFKPLQISAIHYRNHKKVGLMLNEFLIDRNDFSINDLLRSLKSFTGSSKEFAKYLETDGYKLSLLNIYEWFSSKDHSNIPIIVVGNKGSEVQRVFSLINSEFTSRLTSNKEFVVYEINSLIFKTWGVKFVNNYYVGLNTFKDLLKLLVPQLIDEHKSDRKHNALNDVVLTYYLLQYMFVDKNTIDLFKLSYTYQSEVSHFKNTKLNNI